MPMLSVKAIKILKIALNTYGIIWSGLLLACCCILSRTPMWYQEPVLCWPFFHSMVTYTSIYKLHHTLKVQHDTLSYLDLKIWLLSFSKGIFLAYLYLSLAAHYMVGSILFFILAMASIYCQNYLTKQKAQ